MKGYRLPPHEEQDHGYSSPCWVLALKPGNYGYVRLRWRGLRTTAHRVFYTLLVDEIPEGLVLDHLCRVRCCVNPAHLEPVTNEENIRRGERAHRMQCANGHPFDESNTRIDSDRRTCRRCAIERQRVYRERRRQAVEA